MYRIISCPLLLTHTYTPLYIYRFWNAVIYIRPRYLRYRRKQMDSSASSNKFQAVIDAVSVQAQDEDEYRAGDSSINAEGLAGDVTLEMHMDVTVAASEDPTVGESESMREVQT